MGESDGRLKQGDTEETKSKNKGGIKNKSKGDRTSKNKGSNKSRRNGDRNRKSNGGKWSKGKTQDRSKVSKANKCVSAEEEQLEETGAENAGRARGDV